MTPRLASCMFRTVLPLAASMLLTHAVLAQSGNGDAVVARGPATSAGGTARVTVAVATRALQRGEVLQASDVAMIDTVIVWRWSMPPREGERVQAGWVAQRMIAAGELLRTPSVQPPLVITGGSVVNVIYQDGSVQLKLSGTAINSAALGAPVSIRIDRNRRLEGIAIAPNTVRLR